jgi:phosphatidylserine/phosphatidylglycerophosphate/cardiolipin synthase-like enzyme
VEALTAALARAARTIAPVQVEGLASFLSGQSGPTPLGRSQAKALFPTAAFRATVDAVWAAWAGVPALPGAGVALGLRASQAAVQADRAAERVELVATGPTTWLVPLRRTDDVLLRVIEGARSRLFVLSFATYRVPAVHAALVAALDRRVQVTLLLEDEDLGDLKAANAYDDLAPRAKVLVWPLAQRSVVNGHVPKMHAKAAIADGSVAFITSANLTGSGLERNMELGTWVRGGPLPGKLEQHFQQLLAARVLEVVGSG